MRVPSLRYSVALTVRAGYGLGLGKYSETFAANDVDFRVLPDLNSTDLQELGVSLGHRKIMLAAIAALREGKPQKPELQTKQEQLTGVAVDTRLGPSTAEAVSEPGPDVTRSSGSPADWGTGRSL